MELFVVGDVHGSFDKLTELLTNWNPLKEQLILLGDLIDRGPKSMEVVRLVMELNEKYGAISLGGNHEDVFLDWLEDPLETDFYYNIGGRETINSFFKSNVTDTTEPITLANTIKKNHSREVEFLRNLPDFFESEDYIFVHAGLNLMLLDWKNSNNKDFRWSRAQFTHVKNETGKKIVFGHTRTCLLNDDKSHDIWISPCGSKIGIDGACVFGGLLHGLKISGDTRTLFSV